MKPIHLNCRCCCWWFHLCGAAIAVVTVVVVSIRVLHSYQTVAVRTVGYFKFLIKRKTAVISASEKRQQKIDLTQKRIELISSYLICVGLVGEFVSFCVHYLLLELLLRLKRLQPERRKHSVKVSCELDD